MHGPLHIRVLNGIALLLALAILTSAAAQPLRVAVAYPRVTGAYAKVFENILSGVGDEDGIEVVVHEMAEGDEPAKVQSWLARQRVDALIALGHQGYRVAKELNLDMPVVVGAAMLAPNGVAGISLAANPEQFFKRLGSLTPPVKRVFLVYSEPGSGWLIPLADEAARRYGIELRAFEAPDMREAARHYRAILAEVRDPQDAIWLPLDSITPDKAILPQVLDAAWKKRLVVFSNNPAHVEKGALFSLFPDHRGMGRRLAQMVVDRARTRTGKPAVVPLNDLKLAVNVRTASHLGMLYSPGQQRDFALVFPSQ